MKTIFYVLSLVVIAAAAFFTYSNSSKIQEEIDEYAETRSRKVVVENTIAEKEKALSDTKTALEASERNNAVLKNTLTNEQSKEQNSRRSLAGYQTQIEESDAELEKFAQAEAAAKEKLGPLTWEELTPTIRKLEDERKEKAKRMAELDVLVEGLAKKIEDQRLEHTRQTSNLEEVRRKIALNAKVGAITFVDSNWGFVVVNMGSQNSNITPQSKLLVTRNGRLIGTLTPNSIEPIQTICDLNVRDLAPGVRIQPGDRVTLADTAGGR